MRKCVLYLIILIIYINVIFAHDLAFLSFRHISMWPICTYIQVVFFGPSLPCLIVLVLPVVNKIKYLDRIFALGHPPSNQFLSQMIKQGTKYNQFRFS